MGSTEKVYFPVAIVLSNMEMHLKNNHNETLEVNVI